MPSLATISNELYTGKRSPDIVGNRRRWLAIGLALVIGSLLVLGIKGINPGVEFRGGSQFTVSGAATLDQALADEVLADLGAGEAPRVSAVGADSVRVQTAALTAEQ